MSDAPVEQPGNELLKDPETGFTENDRFDEITKMMLKGSYKIDDRYVGGSHYEEMDIEPVDVVDEWPTEQQIGAYRFACLKHNMRMGTKDERIKEAKKLKWYAAKLVEVLEKEED